MGYSCTAAALRTLQVIKAMFGKDLEPSNEIRLPHGRLVFFETQREQPDGSIVGTVSDLRGEAVGNFRINADGSIARFAGLTKAMRGAAEYHSKNPAYRAEWRAVI